MLFVSIEKRRDTVTQRVDLTQRPWREPKPSGVPSGLEMFAVGRCTMAESQWYV